MVLEIIEIVSENDEGQMWNNSMMLTDVKGDQNMTKGSRL